MILKKKQTFIFFICYSFYLAYSFIGIDSVIGVLLKDLTNVASIGLIFLFISNIKKFTYTEFFAILILTILCLVIGLNTKDFGFLKLMLFTLAFKNVEFKKCIQYDIWLRIFLIFIIYNMYTIGLLTDVVGTRGDIVCRHSYGFSNPNALAMAVTILCFEFLYVYGHKKLKLKMCIVAIIMAIVSSVTDSRTCLFAVIIYMVLLLINSYIPLVTHNKFFLKAIQLTPFFLTLAIVYMIQSYILAPYSHESMLYDDLLSGRLYIASVYATLTSPSLLGNDISVLYDRTLDIAYASLLLSSGVVILILFLISYYILIKKLFLSGNFRLLLIYFCFCLMGIGEKLWLYVDYNLLILAFGMLLFQDKSLLRKQFI